jgi:uroporphyrinogen III methyltransferase/synthase
MSANTTEPGKVFLVGAGPGDPKLITLRGVECLHRADLVLYDYLVNPAILRHAKATAELLCLGHHGTQRCLPQEQINTRMVEAAQAGRVVVRLKGGDPDVFGRSAEEMEALRAAGIAYETVPGVTAALAAAGYAGIPMTHGDHSSALALVTGQERRSKKNSRLDYQALADFPGTLVLYMGVTSAGEWSEALVRRGKPAATPVMIVRRCTWPDQRTIRCTLGSLAATIAEQRIRPPAVIVVGEVVSLAPETSWFTRRPLFGCRVLVTRPRDQALELVEPLEELGAEVLVQPVIQIFPPNDWSRVDAALNDLDRFDWLVFSSSNGVRYFLERLCEKKGDLRGLGRIRLAAIGPGTAEELARHRLKADLVPDEYRAEALADALAGEAAGRRILLARASRGREVLAERLSAAGAIVEQVVVYRSVDVETAEPPVAELLGSKRVQWVTVSSSTIARSLVRLFGEGLRQTKLASISPVTSATLRELGYEPAAEARHYTMAGLVEAILDAE